MKRSVMISYMRRILTLLIAVHCSLFSAFAQERSFESTPLTAIAEGWKAKTIGNVANGSLGIMLERFDQTWPTWMMGAVRTTMEQGRSREVLDAETDLTVTIDSKNGYASVSDGGTDGEYMSACYWNRPNGHKLLAVLLGQPTDPCIELLCTYDYDPQKKTLTPEPGILKGYRWGDKGSAQLFCHLPKQGKTVLVDEWGDEGPVRHTFDWDGTKPVYAKTEPLEYDDGRNEFVVSQTDPNIIPVSFKGKTPNIKDFVTAILSQKDLGEGLGFVAQSWEWYRSGMKLAGESEFIVDVQNGYVGYTDTSEEDQHVNEFCYWNCADGKHKLVAVSFDYLQSGKPILTEVTGLTFYLYDNASRKMKVAYASDFGLDFEMPPGCTGVAHALPRQGKTIAFTCYMPSGETTKRYTWNGSRFVKDK